MDAINSSGKSDHELISTDVLEDIRDGSHTDPKTNIR